MAKKKTAAEKMSEGRKKGGRTTRDRYGNEFYQEIGRKGGETVRDERGSAFYEEIGQKGGARTRNLIAAGKRALERR